MRQQVRRQFLDALLRACGGGERGPSRFSALDFARLELRRNFREGGIHLAIPQVQLDLPGRVEDRHRRAIFLRLPDGVGVDDVAEYLFRIRTGKTDGRPGEAEPPRVGQRLGEVARVAL
jgi:hypothetical protein